jgi:hypothetical protein
MDEGLSSASPTIAGNFSESPLEMLLSPGMTTWDHDHDDAYRHEPPQYPDTAETFDLFVIIECLEIHQAEPDQDKEEQQDRYACEPIPDKWEISYIQLEDAQKCLISKVQYLQCKSSNEPQDLPHRFIKYFSKIHKMLTPSLFSVLNKTVF